MNWIYLSPHLDDAVLSCGGMIWEQVQTGQTVEIWTICAGDPPGNLATPLLDEMHRRWNTGPDAAAIRRAEDAAACRRLGVRPRYFDIPDCVYRFRPDGKPLIQVNDDLWSAPYEPELERRLSAQLAAEIPSGSRVVCPLTMGNHVDHRLVRAAIEHAACAAEHAACASEHAASAAEQAASREQSRRAVWYYPDFPYAAHADVRLEDFVAPDWQIYTQPVGETALAAWQDAVLAYASQISTFWANEAQERAEIRAYRDAGGGVRLWTSSPVQK